MIKTQTLGGWLGSASLTASVWDDDVAAGGIAFPGTHLQNQRKVRLVFSIYQFEGSCLLA